MEDNLKQIYIDGVNDIHFVNGMVRISVGSIIPGDNNDNIDDLKFKSEYRIIMPLNSFISAFAYQKQLLDQLTEKGILAENTEKKKQLL